MEGVIAQIAEVKGFLTALTDARKVYVWESISGPFEWVPLENSNLSAHQVSAEEPESSGEPV